MEVGQPYPKQWWMKYWDVEISQSPFESNDIKNSLIKARFKKNIFTKSVFIFRSNCKPEGNRWNEPGYGWGVWEKL